MRFGHVMRGIVAGAVGTTALTIVQMLEIKSGDREPSTAPADAVEKTTPAVFSNEEQKEKASIPIHFVYGTSWGIVYSLLRRLGLRPLPASGLFTALVWGNALWMLPALGLAEEPSSWGTEELTKDIGRHAVYAAGTSLTYELLNG